MQIEELKEIGHNIIEQVESIIVGERLFFMKLLCASLANSHVLIEDYPGLGKTLLVKIFAKTVGCRYKRIQFTPDLMPADILGTKVWRPASSEFVFEKGPIFTNFLLADEINRSPPKTQSALLEAMEERHVTIEGTLYPLERPFFVVATQNPLEMEGTYPLPEAQLDRFSMKLSPGYPRDVQEEVLILKRRINWRKDDPTDTVEPVVDDKTFLEMQEVIENEIYVDDQILHYIAEIVRLTRQHPMVEVGSSPRGGIFLLKLSRALAALSGRDYVIPDDVKLFTKDVLTHRMILNVESLMKGASPASIIEEIVSKVDVPKEVARR
jgi:MoxR-like ATPase